MCRINHMKSGYEMLGVTGKVVEEPWSDTGLQRKNIKKFEDLGLRVVNLAKAGKLMKQMTHVGLGRTGELGMRAVDSVRTFYRTIRDLWSGAGTERSPEGK